MAARSKTTQLNSAMRATRNKDIKGNGDSSMKIDRKMLIISIIVGVLLLSSAVGSIFRQASSAQTDMTTSNKPQMAGVDIPSAVLAQMREAKEDSAKQEILQKWATSEGIEFRYEDDGSIKAVRDSVEYVLQPPNEERGRMFKQQKEAREEYLREHASDTFEDDDDENIHYYDEDDE